MASDDSTVLEVSQVSFRYGARLAVDGVTFTVKRGEVFGLLGPNGGGKTTLFRMLGTLYAPSSGSVRLLGREVALDITAARQKLGIVFQAPSLDKKLTVRENLRHQGHLYGLRGRELEQRIDGLLERLALADRARDLVQTLSGGLSRRVELAKGLLNRPPLLLLDEPSTGLDPGARRTLWDQLRELRARDGTTVILTTHLMEEADLCDRVAIMDRGRLVALAAPDELKRELGGDVITVTAADAAELARGAQERFGVAGMVADGVVRFECESAPALVTRMLEAFPRQIESITWRRPSLEDVFLRKTGHQFLVSHETGSAA
jgi:ABC-2 type transport system ATP-binding protein